MITLSALVIAAFAFMAGAVFHLKSYGPFGNRYRILGAASQSIAKPVDKYSKTEMTTGIEELLVET
jgi:hypothetical protein